MLPVHLLCYQRPELLKKQLELLTTNKVYFSVDKPKIQNKETQDNYEKIIEIINSYNNSEKEIILFDSNLGYLKHFIQSVSFILKKEEKIIHLEDDIIPTNAFYSFCNFFQHTAEPIFGFSSNFSEHFNGMYFKTFVPQFYWGACFTREWGTSLIKHFNSSLNEEFLIKQIIFLDKINQMHNDAFKVHVDNLKLNLKILKGIGEKTFFNWVTDSLAFTFLLMSGVKTIRPTVSLVSPSRNDKYCLTKNILFETYQNVYKPVTAFNPFKEIKSPYKLDEQNYTSILA